MLRQLGELEGSNQSELAKRQMRVKKQDEDLQTEISRVEEALRSRQIAAMLNVSDEDLKQKLLKALKIAAEDVQSTDSVLGEGTFSGWQHKFISYLILNVLMCDGVWYDDFVLIYWKTIVHVAFVATSKAQQCKVVTFSVLVCAFVYLVSI